jgi:hypothetical protein
VYEAKKRCIRIEKAEDQIYHAAQTYLALLDDLVRDPEDVNLYQSEESKRFQIFCFTSSGLVWAVYVVYPFLDSFVGHSSPPLGDSLYINGTVACRDYMGGRRRRVSSRLRSDLSHGSNSWVCCDAALRFCDQALKTMA